jgi:hypothetical protein
VTTLDALLWSVAAMLFSFAAWLHTREDDGWSAAELLVAVWRAVRGAVPPITGGAVPAEGWDGELETLPRALHPERRLGHGLTWDDLGGPRAAEAAARRLEGVSIVWFDPPAVAVEGVPCSELPRDAGPEATQAHLDARLRTPPDRLVLAASAHAMDLLRLLHGAPGLRDRTRAVLLVDAVLDTDWLRAHFDHLAFDTELLRTLPFLQITAPVADRALLPEPLPPPNGRRALAVTDLGAIAPEHRADPALQRTLMLVLAALGS